MNLTEILPIAAPSNNFVIFGYTPFCGTCKLAEQMLDITTNMMNIEVLKIDLNYAAALSEAYQVMSVPVLLIVRDNEVVDIVYRFQSVTNLFEILKKHLTD